MKTKRIFTKVFSVIAFLVILLLNSCEEWTIFSCWDCYKGSEYKFICGDYDKKAEHEKQGYICKKYEGD